VDAAWAVSGRQDPPPITRFLAEQLSTAHWFDQRRTRAALGWEPRVSLEEGFARLAAWYAGSADAPDQEPRYVGPPVP
jgi:nucleoside-diphosphate-sugar epimerase